MASSGVVQFLVWTLVMLMVLAGIVLVLRILSGPSHATSVAEIGKHFDRACSSGKDEFRINLPQKKPLLIYDGTDRIGVDGDPKYLLYYERFPIGDSISWDWLERKNFPVVVYSILTENTAKDIESYRESLEKKADGMFPDNNGIVVEFLNLELQKSGLFGNSRKTDRFGKFETCADDSLCLKEGENAIPYKLRQCADNGIDWITIYTHRWRVLRLIKIDPEDFQFSLASPCSENVVAEKATCPCERIDMPVFDSSGHLKSYTTFCDNEELFGTHKVVDIPCLRIHIEPDYSSSYCYNRELEDQIIEKPKKITDLLSLSGPAALVGGVAGGLALVAGAPVVIIGGVASAVFAGAFYQSPPPSLRDDCIKKVDEHSIAIDPLCLDNLKVKAVVDMSQISGAKKAIKDAISNVFSIQNNNAIWEVWPLNRPVIS